MGSGKSTLGTELAGLLSLPFYDLDNLLIEKEKRTISEIFKNSGEEYFRKIEHEILSEQVRKNNFILATGGGTPCYFNNMELMNREGITVYFKLSPLKLFGRLKNDYSSRPLLSHFKLNELSAFITGKLRERERWYLKSKLVITEMEQDAETVSRIIKKYSFSGQP